MIKADSFLIYFFLFISVSLFIWGKIKERNRQKKWKEDYERNRQEYIRNTSIDNSIRNVNDGWKRSKKD